MTYPACFVSWCAMTPEVGANPLWHGCLILSVQRDEYSPVQVLDAVGFYGVTPCSDSNGYVRRLKEYLKVNIDLTDGFGELRREEMRYMDKFSGLKGITFHITKYQLRKLRNEINNDMFLQEQAKNEAWQSIAEDMFLDEETVEKAKLALAADDASTEEESVKAYLLEQAKRHAKPTEVFAKEKMRAEKYDCKPRLEPFELRRSWTPFSFITLADSHTCKSKAVGLLNKIHIALKWLNELGLSSSAASIPRFSGKANAEWFRLYSEGAYSEHVSQRTGKRTLFREWQPTLDSSDPQKTALYWALPPNKIVANNSDLKGSQAFIEKMVLPDKVYQPISQLVKQLGQVGELLLQSVSANKEEDLSLLLDKLSFYTKAFNSPARNQNLTYVKKMFDESRLLLIDILLSYNSGAAKSYEVKIAQEVCMRKIAIKLSDPEGIKLEEILADKVVWPEDVVIKKQVVESEERPSLLAI